MAASLEHEFGVPVRWIEAGSRTTHENAVLSARTLKKDGIDRVILVTHGFDTRRAMAEFQAQGLAVVGARDRTARRIGRHDSRLRSEHGRSAGQLLRDLRDSRQSGSGRASEPLRVAMPS